MSMIYIINVLNVFNVTNNENNQTALTASIFTQMYNANCIIPKIVSKT